MIKIEKVNNTRKKIKEIKPAAGVLEDMVEEAMDILTRKLPENVVAA